MRHPLPGDHVLMTADPYKVLGETNWSSGASPQLPVSQMGELGPQEGQKLPKVTFRSRGSKHLPPSLPSVPPLVKEMSWYRESMDLAPGEFFLRDRDYYCD